MSSAAAYTVGAWHTSSLDAKNDGPQCSASGEFCFLCEFRNSGGTDGADPCADIKALIALMIEQKKELPVVVDAVQATYRNTIQSDVVYTHRVTNQIVTQPDWSSSSIEKHLLFSSEFPQVFSNVVVNIHQALIMRLNAQMINTNTNEVNEETRRSFVDTIASLSRWYKACK